MVVYFRRTQYLCYPPIVGPDFANTRILLGKRPSSTFVAELRSGRSTPPLDFIELLRRPRVTPRILSSNREPHRMSATHIAPNQPMMRDILPHFASQLGLNLQILQRVLLKPCLLSTRELRRGGCCFRRNERRRGERECRECRDGAWGGEEGRDGSDLWGREVAYSRAVVDLEAGAYARGCVVADPVEGCERELCKVCVGE